MSDEFKKAFSDLSINQKRNQISSELLFMSELIKNLGLSCGYNSNISVFNYDSMKDKGMKETELLDHIYESIYLLKNEIIKIMASK